MSEFPRERSCDIAGAGHSIPSGISAMKPAGSLKVDCKVKWLKDEKFSVVIDGAVVTMRHHNPERLRAVLDSSRLESTQIHPKYELLMVKFRGAKYALRFLPNIRRIGALQSWSLHLDCSEAKIA